MKVFSVCEDRMLLVGNAANVSIAAEEETLANDLLRRLAGVPLVDAYAAYQVLDDSFIWHSD